MAQKKRVSKRGPDRLAWLLGGLGATQTLFQAVEAAVHQDFAGVAVWVFGPLTVAGATFAVESNKLSGGQ